ncbi:MAG TPA: hypothetical protein ENN08_03375 [Bacteroidales bacterium]|nr:hypothetical protein [Bacteroidales bacterium]
MKTILFRTLAGIMSGFMLFFCNPVHSTKTPTMKEKTYEKLWQKADSLKDAALPKAAMAVVEAIRQQAAAEKNPPEYVKAILYDIRLRSDFEEDHLEKSIAMMDAAISKADMPAFAVLHSIQAELYFRYFTANRHLILDRTMVEGNAGKDIKTWDATAIISKAAWHYLESLKNAAALKQTPAAAFSAILSEMENSKTFRPTLFDLLGHRALDFFMNPQASLIQPHDPFNINNEIFFDEAAVFANQVLEKPEALSFNHHALEILRQLTGFHLTADRTAALVDVDLKRLAWLRNSSTLANKDHLYMQALEHLESRFGNTEVFPEIAYVIATELVRIGNTWHPFANPKPRLKLKEAREKLELAIERYPNQPFTKNCRHLLQQITEPSLQIQAGQVNLPGKPFKALVSHKNIEEIHLRLIRLEPETDRDLRAAQRNDKDLINTYLGYEPCKAWRQALPDDGDMQTHNTEIPFPELPPGYYVLVAGFDEAFSTEPHTLPFSSFWSSSLSYVSRRMADGSIEFLLLDRENGKPLSNVSATAYHQQYNPGLRRHEFIKGKTYTTSREGTFTVEAPGRRAQSGTMAFDFSYRNDRLFTDNFFAQHRYERDRRMRTQTRFFTDRAIYRPGQTVYFKGISIDSDGETHELKTGHRTTVILYDVNRRKISEISLTTNEHGSFSGNFALPSDLLTGNFQLSNEHGSLTFSVEDYKLPRFEVIFDSLKDSYKLGESLTVKGQALAYAGNPVSNAEVRFRVTRQTRFPFRYHHTWDVFPTGPPTEILNGTLQTDAEGNFTITFEAAPDLSIPQKHNPVFIFNVMADVTDIQGETQSGSTSIGVGYVALLLSADIPENLNRNDFDGFGIKATNLNGQDQKISGEMILSKLQQPGRLLRARNYPRPDRFVMDKAAHNKMFPLDVYDNEDDPASWEVEREILTIDFDTGDPGKILPAGFRNWAPGTYLVELKTTDAFGQAVEFKKHFTIFSPSDRRLAHDRLWWSQVLTPALEPRQKALIMIGSSVRLPLLVQVEVNGEIVSSRRLRLNRRTRVIEIPVTESHLGGFRVLFTSVAHNRAFAEAITINVPDRRKELDIKLETKRNRLEPGSREEWRISINDHKGNPVSAEMLAAMYDASLDALKQHNWFFNLHSIHQQRFNWEPGASFGMARAHAAFFGPYPEFYIREYDRLNWFGFDMFGYPFRDFMTEGMRAAGAPMMMDMAAPMPEAKALMTVDDKAVQMPEEPPLPPDTPSPAMMVRRDFRETAFFYPHLLSDADGFVNLSFTVPESLTRWRMMGLAHAKDLKNGRFEEFFESSREVMVVPNPPRFLRQADRMDFRAKVVNTSAQEIDAVVHLELFDAVTMQPVNELYGLGSDKKNLKISTKGAADTSWEINVPQDGPYAVIYRITAIAGAHSDGEENMLPVLTNRKLLTESMPMYAGAGESRSFTFDKLLQSSRLGSTAVNHQLTLEFTSNPVWYVVQALPYLSEPAYRSAEAIFQQFYANQIARHIVDANPEIERVFEVWRRNDPSALRSNLEKNQDLKSVAIEETPWLNDALGESERKRQIAALFDRNQITAELEKSLKALADMQLRNGGWPWMPGMRDSRHVTQQIVAGFGRLQALGAMNVETNPDLSRRLQEAIYYLDERMNEEFNNLKKPVDPESQAPSTLSVQYLWARTYWIGRYPVNRNHQESFGFWKNQAEKHWTKQSIYFQGMIALAMHRLGERTLPAQILRSLSDRSLSSEEMGIYWRDFQQGYFWYQAPIETQSLLVEAYATISNDMATVEKMQQWLITQKRTQAWKSNRATAEAIYAILMRGTQSLVPNRDLNIKIGNITINPATDSSIREEAGSGYFRMSWNRGEISPEMAKITVNNGGSGIAWGGLYWQYFEQLDRIAPHETPLKLSRSIMRETLTPSGPVLETVSGDKPLQIGEKMIMRIELRVDRDLEYVHMKDLRAPAFEPIEQLSGYRYQGGLGYYQSPRDAGTHFFFQYLPKGTWVFEYPVVVSQTGDFITGITTIQCLYAPEFTAHSEGIRVEIK